MLWLTYAPKKEPDTVTAGEDSVDGIDPVLPDYGGACLSSLLGALRARNGPEGARWLPEPCLGSAQVALVVLDGLGWEQLRTSASVAPTLAGAAGGRITSVAPTTTATALTSITTGKRPCEHGVVGYRMRVTPEGDVLNVLQWRTARGDMRRRMPAPSFQDNPPFDGARTPAVTRAEFAATGFTALHLAGTRLVGWSTPSSLVVHVRRLLASGSPLVYSYYDGLDKVAHTYGLGEFYEEELRAVDRWVGDLVETLPGGCSLVVTSDHGQVEVGGATRMPSAELLAHTEMLSGEGRFRWLHARAGAATDLLAAATEEHGDEAWVRSREEVVEERWFGGPLKPEVEARLGDVALVARDAVAFLDPADTGETKLAARHGSLTPAEMYVPLIAWAGS